MTIHVSAHDSQTVRTFYSWPQVLEWLATYPQDGATIISARALRVHVDVRSAVQVKRNTAE